MDGSQFDRLTRAMGAGVSRRTLMTRVVGIGATVAGLRHAAQDADAARRGFSGPKFPRTQPRCQVPADCPPCRCTGAQGIECNTCVVDLNICRPYRFDCPGCCETVDDVGVCGCGAR